MLFLQAWNLLVFVMYDHLKKLHRWNQVFREELRPHDTLCILCVLVLNDRLLITKVLADEQEKGGVIMEYTQISVRSTEYPERFNRVIAVKGNPDLYSLGAIIGSSLNVWFEHCYLFTCKKPERRYAFDEWMEDPLGDYLPMSKYHLSDLGDTFRYEYDAGEGYEFNCKVYKRKVNRDPDEDGDALMAFVVKGVGQGIFENDHYTLGRYLTGEIDPESSEESEDPWQYLPMNMAFDKYGDFDLPLDYAEYEYYDEEIEMMIRRWRE